QHLGVTLEWLEGDAQSLPFPDADFDVVTSAFGAMFAPDHQRVANELLRVCRPGGTVAMLNFTSGCRGAAFFDLLGAYLPPQPAGAQRPLLWGGEQHVQDLFGNRLGALRLTRGVYVETATDPREYFDFYARTFGPVVAIRNSLSSAALA